MLVLKDAKWFHVLPSGISSGECPLYTPRSAFRFIVVILVWGTEGFIHRARASAEREREQFPDNHTLGTECVPFCSAVSLQSAADPTCRYLKSLGFNRVPGACSSRGPEVCLVCLAGCTAVPFCLGLPCGLLAFLLIAAILLTNERMMPNPNLREKRNKANKIPFHQRTLQESQSV